MATEIYNADSHYLYLTTYDDVTFVVGGEIDGDHFQLTYDNSAVSKTEGAKGDVQFSIRVAGMATLTKTLQWGAADNKVLNQVYKDQKDGNYLKTAELKRITNSENVSVMSCSRALLNKRADYNIGSAAGDRAWVIDLEKAEFNEVQAPS